MRNAQAALHTTVRQALGKRIRALRQARGWSQEELGAQIGQSKSSISRLEAGLQNPSLDDLIALAAAFGVEPVAIHPEHPRRACGQPS